MILVDTSVWIHYLRSPNTREGQEMDSLLERNEVLITGVVIAEILQGVRAERQRSALESCLRRLPYEDPDKDGWVLGANLASRLRSQGQEVSLLDLAIAAVALNGNHEVYTLDGDFQRVPGLRLHEVAAR